MDKEETAESKCLGDNPNRALNNNRVERQE